MDRQIKEIVLNNSQSIIDMWVSEVRMLRESTYQHIPKNLIENTDQEFVNVIFSSIQNNGSSSELNDFSEKLIKLGWPLSYITDGIQVFRRILIEHIMSEMKLESNETILFVLKSVENWVEPIIHYLVSEYSGNWEHTVSLQRSALQELSAPLIPVMDGITIMPLIGAIDTERAKLIMENLLEGVIRHNAEVVLIDITGLPVVDTMVAHHIIQAAEAVRIIGSTCILVGIRPEIAQTIVSLGIDLKDFPTKSSLEKGFTAALEMTNRKVIKLKETYTIDQLIDSLHKE